MTESSYVVVGAFARIDVADGAAVRERIGRLDGVSTFDLERPETLGILIEAADVDAAHQILVERVRHARGVLGVWPVSVESDDTFEPEAECSASAHGEREPGTTGD